MSKPITQAERDLFAEIKREGGAPWERLKAKCQWEHMGQMAVLREWGDPRTWHRPHLSFSDPQQDAND